MALHNASWLQIHTLLVMLPASLILLQLDCPFKVIHTLDINESKRYIFRASHASATSIRSREAYCTTSIIYVAAKCCENSFRCLHQPTRLFITLTASCMDGLTALAPPRLAETMRSIASQVDLSRAPAAFCFHFACCPAPPVCFEFVVRRMRAWGGQERHGSKTCRSSRTED